MSRTPHQRGLTVFELVMAIGIFAIMVVPLGALVYKSQMARRDSQDSLYSQQDAAVVLSRFTDDVRASTHMTSSLADSLSVTMRRPTSLTTFVHVTWRLSGGRLQRGESPTEGLMPASWQDVIDPVAFTVEEGRFAFYTLNNGTPRTTDEARRLELGALRLKSKATGATLSPSPVSAVMREPAQARALTASGDWETWGDDMNWNRAVHVRFPFKNGSGKDLAIGAFSATWDDQKAGGYIKSMDLAASNSSTWGGGQAEYRSGDAPQALDRPLSIGKGETATIKFHFMAEKPIETFTMTLFETTDTTRSWPYVLKAK